MIDHYGYYHNASDKDFISKHTLRNHEPDEWPDAIICTHDNCQEWGDFEWYFPERTCRNKEAWNTEASTFECSECLWDNFTISEDFPRDEIIHCPKCGAKVVE